MAFVSHPLLKENSIEARAYQTSIANTACSRNTLCVLPTGLGKTAIAIMVAANRLASYPDSKVLVLAPTRPLAEQHLNSFSKAMNLVGEQLLLVTGNVEPEKRAKLYKFANVICATPQTVENDVESGRLSLADVSLLVVDEVHRAVKKYAYPWVAKVYLQKAQHPRILGLTASPGSDETVIKDITAHLGIEAVEIRSEADPDVAPYVQEQQVETERVGLDGPLLAAQIELKLALAERLKRLRGWKLHAYNKRDLLDAQRRIQVKLANSKRPIYYQYLSHIAETIKLWYALELVETQSVAAAGAYMDKLADGDSRAAKRLVEDPKVKNAMLILEKLKGEGTEHPKMLKLEELVKEELTRNPELKIIIFSHYRENIAAIARRLGGVSGCRPAILIGQAKRNDDDTAVRGQSQREQIDIIRDYEVDVHNTLITSPIGEEGLHLASADLAIFYEPVASEIRTIQRRGRVGRTKLGKIVVLMTRGTRDEANFYTAKRKEAKMKEIMHRMQRQEKQGTGGQASLGEF